MKVYIVYHADYDAFEILAVYDSREKAAGHIAALPVRYSETDGEIYAYVGEHHDQLVGVYEDLEQAKRAIAEYDHHDFGIAEWTVQ